MRPARLLIYALAALVGLYLLAAVLYAFPMAGGLIDDTMEVKFDHPDPSIVADYGNGLNATQKQGFYHLSQGSEIMPWIVRTAVDVADPNSAEPFVENLERYGLLPDPGRGDGSPVGLKLGFVVSTDCSSQDCLVDTTQTGDRNAGHLWGTDMSDSDRMALLEHLKTY